MLKKYIQTLSAKLLINNFLIGTPSSVTSEKSEISVINESNVKNSYVKTYELTKQFHISLLVSSMM